MFVSFILLNISYLIFDPCYFNSLLKIICFIWYFKYFCFAFTFTCFLLFVSQKDGKSIVWVWTLQTARVLRDYFEMAKIQMCASSATFDFALSLLESIMWFNVVAFWDNYCFTLLFSFFSLEYVLLSLTIWFGTTKFLKINRQNKWSFFLCFRPHPNSLSHISLDWFSFLLLLSSVVVVVGKVFLSFLAGFLFAKNIVFFLFYKQRIYSPSSRGLDTRAVINGVFKWNHKHCWNCCPLLLVV